jgi:hypothetical protein
MYSYLDSSAGKEPFFVFPDPTAYAEGKIYAHAYAGPYGTAFRWRRNLRGGTGRRELGKFGEAFKRSNK